MTVVTEPAQAGFLLDRLADDDVADEAVEAEKTGSNARWHAADCYSVLAGRGWTQRRIGERVGKSHSHVTFCLKAVSGYPSNQVRPDFQDAYEAAKKPSAIYERNANGAHEGLALSDGDAGGDGWRLLLGDMRDRMAEIPEASVDLIVTDPPYPAEFLPLWDELAEQAARVLTSRGVLLARCGHLFLPDVLDKLRSSLAFGWLYAEPLPGSNVRFQGRKVAVSWQPWLAFTKNAWPSGSIEWHPDTLTESPRTKARYVWEQKWDVAAELIATFATAGMTVLDPFAGSGTYGVAALSVGCRWTGIELDPAGHAQAAERLATLS